MEREKDLRLSHRASAWGSSPLPVLAVGLQRATVAGCAATAPLPVRAADSLHCGLKAPLLPPQPHKQTVPHLQTSVSPQGPEFLTPGLPIPFRTAPIPSGAGHRGGVILTPASLISAHPLSAASKSKGEVRLQPQQTPVAPCTGLLCSPFIRRAGEPGSKGRLPCAPVWLELNQHWRADGINSLKAEAVEWESQHTCTHGKCFPAAARGSESCSSC